MSNFYEYDITSPQSKSHFDKHSSAFQFNSFMSSFSKKNDDKVEFNRHDANDRHRALCLLKEMIGASRDFALKDKSCYQDDEFLDRFLYARKFNVTEAFQLLINYNLYRQRNQELLQRLCVLDDNIQMALRDGFPGVLKSRDRRGRKVLIFITSNWDFTQYSLLTVFRSMLLSLEKLLEDKQNQANGFIAIVDWTNFTLRQSSHLNPKVLKLMIEGLQDCFPVRFKAIHFIGQPWYVEAALAVIKPFLKDKTRERIKLHGSNLSTLHEVVARDILPPELGGEGPTFNPLTWYHILLESSQMNTQLPSYCITQTAIYTKSPIIQINGNNNNNINSSSEKISTFSKSIIKIPIKSKGDNGNGNGTEHNQLLNFNSDIL